MLLILLTGAWTMAVLSNLRDLVVVSILQLLSKSARFLQGEILSRNSSIFLSKYWCENRYGFNSSLLFSACRFDLAATSLKGLCGAVGCCHFYIEIPVYNISAATLIYTFSTLDIKLQLSMISQYCCHLFIEIHIFKIRYRVTTLDDITILLPLINRDSHFRH